MADISKIKLPDNTTYNIKDTITEIGGRNLLVGSYKYTAETPFVNTTTVTDGYKYLNDVHTIIQVHTGENYIVQAKTDGDWSTRHGEQPANFVTLWMVGSANLSPITYDAHQVFITAQINTNPNYLGDGKWIWTIPSNWDGKYICVRVNNYNTDGTTSVTHTYWDFKLEKGSKATDWSIAPEDQIAGSGTSGCIAKFDGANTVTSGPAFGNSTSTYLRNDGIWTTINDMYVRQRYQDDTVEKYYMPLLGEHDTQYSEYSETETTGTRKAIGLNYCIKDGTHRKLTISATDGSLTQSVELKPLGTSKIPILQSSKIDCNGTVYANSVDCNSMSVTDISSQYTITKSSGNWTLDAVTVHRTGNVVELAATFKGNGSAVSAGSNAFVGKCTAGPLPLVAAKGISFVSSGGIVFQIDTAGNAYARVIGSSITLASSSTNTVPIVFIIND